VHQFAFISSTGVSHGRETFQFGLLQWNVPQRWQKTTRSPKYAGCVSRNAAAASAVSHQPRSLPSDLVQRTLTAAPSRWNRSANKATTKSGLPGFARARK
jgi:hypothetical protein